MLRRISKKKTVYKNSYVELTQTIQEYRKCREKLISVTNDTINLFNQVSTPLSQEILNCLDTNSLKHVIEELGAQLKKNVKDPNKTEMSSYDIENPVLTIVGQIKAGKSTFVNCLFEKNVVPQCFDQCTDTITRLSYSEKNSIEIIDADGNVKKKKHLKKISIPKKYVSLGENDANISLRVNLKLKFLECGIDVIDTPGLGERACLLSVSNTLINNALPIIIYVIDGRAGVKQTDVADLLELKDLISHVEIIYFITHLDIDGIDDDNNQDALESANKKMHVAFTKLQYFNFIPKSYKHWAQCPYIHGASLTSLIKYSNNIRNPETEYHYYQFCKFYSELNDIIQVYFQYKIWDSCDTVMNFIMDVSAKVINYSQNFDLKTKENSKQIKAIKKIEGEMYLNIKSVITDSKQELMSRLIKHLEVESSNIIEPIIDTIYPSTIPVPENGIVSDPVIIDQCQLTIVKILTQGLESVVQHFVDEELIKNFRNAVREKTFLSLRDSSYNSTARKVSKGSYQILLERILNRKYHLERISRVTPENNQRVFFEFMNVVLTSIKVYLSKSLHVELQENEINVKNPEWKLKQADEYLKKCDSHLLAEDVCKRLFDDFEMKHKEFLCAMEKEAELIGKKMEDSNKIKSEIIEKTPCFFYLFLHTLNIKGTYGFKNIVIGDTVGIGNQSVIYQCTLHGKIVAKKEINLKIYNLKEISEEVFYSKQLSHENLLSSIGVSISSDEKHISIFYPLMVSNLRSFVKLHVMKPKIIKKIALEVAEGLQYLHENGILHKDLKHSNVLIDMYESVVLSDYGFCKSEAIAQYHKERLPIHIAPEIRLEMLYSKKSDIYAFGILLWQLITEFDIIPKGSVYLKHLSQIVWEKYSFQPETHPKPQKLKNISDEMWIIMKKCWSYNPDERPDIDVIITNLEDSPQNI